ncbi:MAG: choice-of-anchor J domain-containing protein [Saprospiraceae bacterium]
MKLDTFTSHIIFPIFHNTISWVIFLGFVCWPVSWLSGQVIFSDGFETGGSGWTVENQQVFAIGTPAPGIGPGGGYNGSPNCAGTNLNGNYPVYSNSRLISPVIQLPSISATELLQIGFWHWWDFDDYSATGDVGTVQISVNNGAWQNLSTVEFDNDSKVWTQFIADLTAYPGSSVRIGFYFVSDYDNNPPYVGAGWYIDEVRIEKKEAGYDLSTEPESFETGIGDWYADNGIWQVGTPRNVGPAGVHAGSQCAGTVIDGNYPGFGNSRLISPNVALPSISANERLLLRFWQWMSSENAVDYGKVQLKVAGTNTWQALSAANIDGASGGWTQFVADLTAYADSSIQIGFYFVSDSDNNVGAGWYIDEVRIEKKEAVYDLSAIPEGFEIGIADWHADNGIWQVGIPQNVGPQSAHAGSQCAGTIIGGNYPVYSNSRLISPEIQLPSLGGTEILQLGFWHWWDFDDWSGTGDVGTVQISINNGAWQNLSTVEYDNDSKAWTQYIADLTAYADSSIRIGFILYQTMTITHLMLAQVGMSMM